MRYMPICPGNPALHTALNQAWRVDETHHLRRLQQSIALPAAARQTITQLASHLVESVRGRRTPPFAVDAFMHEYQLSTQEGVVLMCLAEALLRVPDTRTVDILIRDKLCQGDWNKHLGHSGSMFVNASTWGMLLSGRLVASESADNVFHRLLQRTGEPLVRQAVRQAMHIMARQFVMGRTIDEALQRRKKGVRYSFDMLGEAARTDADSQRYFQAYHQAIETIGRSIENGEVSEKAKQGEDNKSGEKGNPITSPGISIKLSALHPRYEVFQAGRIMDELLPRLRELARQAARYNIGLTLDAEESHRLDLSLMLLEALLQDSGLAGWEGLGLAVQAYQKRAFDLIGWLADLAGQHQRRLMVRLVKGAYWDTEIKRAQEQGLDGYPVFTRKVCTDVSYLACAQQLLQRRDVFYPQFATHNAQTLAAVLTMAGDNGEFECQRLHGMGEALYEELARHRQHNDQAAIPCRVYAPVGSHEDLLPYLVRRLLENGANTSFVNRIVDEDAPISELVGDPLEQAAKLDPVPHPRIPLPSRLYPDRRNAVGLELSDMSVLKKLQQDMQRGAQSTQTSPVEPQYSDLPVVNPADGNDRLGSIRETSRDEIDKALATAVAAFPDWNATPVDQRATCLENMAALLENKSLARLMALCIREAGKTLPDALAEVREAIDFCRYYASQARLHFAPQDLPGPTGQSDQWQLHGRGVIACISPWNFPLAIFLGQISAALVAGNTVLAKPAEQTPLIAAAATDLLHEAGIPDEVLQLLPGRGETVGRQLVDDVRVDGVAFTGGTETAWAINRALAARQAPIAALIAETGGLNAMLVDSSALPEQVVADVLTSGFQSAGQRCSALRVLLLQEDIAPRIINMLCGAMAELKTGNPADTGTDIGPVIDAEALQKLQQYSEHLQKQNKLLYSGALSLDCARGHFFPPQLVESQSWEELPGEVFGPIVHVLRYKAETLNDVIDRINASGYGLTFGIHSRIETTVQHVCRRIRAGNIYVNRNMIGAIVGVQPFGGRGLSGTGPKAGGPHYLLRFTTEQSISTNTAAAGGNAALMTLGE